MLEDHMEIFHAHGHLQTLFQNEMYGFSVYFLVLE